ncbi:MAG: hypothetical protein GY765_12120 [bacterium]|nr:hypothetical protein [bacterium]
MKRVICLTVSVLMLMVLFSGSVMAKKPKDPAWQKVKKVKLFNSVKVFDDPRTATGPIGAKRYFVELVQFRQALEEAGIKETVTMDLVSRGRSKLATLGTYEPKIVGEKSDWSSIPKAVKVEIANSKAMSRTASGSSMSGDSFEQGADSATSGSGENEQDRRFLLPDQGYILFKNAKKKVKARVKVKFMYVSK